MVADFIKFWEPRRRILTYGLSCDFQVDPDSSVARGLPAGAGWKEAAGRRGVGQLLVNDLLLQRDGEHIILCILPDRSSNVLGSKHLLTIVVKVFFRDAPRPIWILQQIRFTLLDRFLVRNRKIPQIIFNCYDSITVVAFVRSLRAPQWC